MVSGSEIMNTLKSFVGRKDIEESVGPGFHFKQLELSHSGLIESNPESMPEKERVMILQVLFENSAFANLTNHQRADLVDNFVRVNVKKNDILFRQGDYGHYFYVLEEGECEVYARKFDEPAIRVATLHRGSSFGELALMYTGYRRATLVATEDTTLWVLDRNQFKKMMTNDSTTDLKAVFERYCKTRPAARKGQNPQHYMTLDGFIAAFTSHRTAADTVHPDVEAENARLKVLFKMVDRDDRGEISFADFAMFTHIMSNPDPEFEIAFRYFDLLTNGTVSREEFEQALRANSSAVSDETMGALDNSFINFDCDLMNRYFGRRIEAEDVRGVVEGEGANLAVPANGNAGESEESLTRALSFPEFAEFFSAFQTEYALQLFELRDRHNEGRITVEDFIEIVPNMSNARAALYSEQFIDCFGEKGTITFAEFAAFQKFINHLPAIERVLRATFRRFPSATINANTFRALVRSHAINTFTPIENTICFHLFGTEDKSLITLSSFKDNVISTPMTHQIFKLDDGTIDVDEQLIDDVPNRFGGEDLRMLIGARDLARNMVLGAVSSGLSAFLVFPFDAIKTRLQYNRSSPEIFGRYSYKHSLDCLHHILVHQGGLRGLFSGVLPVMMGATPEKFVKIFVNDHLRATFKDKNTGGRIFFPLEVLSGAGAGISQAFISTPIEYLKIRLQLQREPLPLVKGEIAEIPKPKNVRAMVREVGLTGIYRGFGACLLRDTLFSAIYFPTYAMLKGLFTDPHTDTISPQGLLLAGGLSAVPAALLTTPLDVIKTRLQAQPITTGKWRLNRELKYRSIADCFFKTTRNEGYRALWKGAGARVCLWGPQFAISLFTYEVLQRRLFPDIIPIPPTHIPINSRDFMGMRTERLQNRLSRVEGELRILQVER
eukprot:CFRG2352T1